ncbi:MAG: cbb3-type cytochrome oxidase assembly protein CcoS [Gammaproteobacteria bacterium]
MEVIYGLIPGMIVVGLAIFGVLIWAARSGQYDDLEGPANRILMDDDDPLLPGNNASQPDGESEKPDTPPSSE